MKVLIRLKSTSQRIELEAKNAYAKSGFYCVYRTDGTVLKYPLADLFDVELHPGMLEARNTPALMKVAIHLKGTHLPIELEADSTEHNAEFFTAKMPSGAIKLYPMANIMSVVEDYNASQQAPPKNKDSGPFEFMHYRSLEQALVQAVEHELHRLVEAIEQHASKFENPKPYCSPVDLTRLCMRGISEVKNKGCSLTTVCRWIGFCMGALEDRGVIHKLSAESGIAPRHLISGLLKAHELEQKRDVVTGYLDIVGPVTSYEHVHPSCTLAMDRCTGLLSSLDQHSLVSISLEIGSIQGLLACQDLIPVAGDEGVLYPLEGADDAPSAEESTRSAMTTQGPITLKIQTPVKLSKIADDFQYLMGLIEIVGRDIEDPKPKCSPEDMLRLCEEGAAGLDKYPEDKLSRWLGFCSGVLQFHEIGCELTSWEGYGSLKHDIGTINPNEIRVMRQLFFRYNEMANAYSETDARVSHAATHCMMVINHMLSFNLNQISVELGLVQGMLAAAGAIDVDTERDFTRPLLHSLHDGPVPSFPTA